MVRSALDHLTEWRWQRTAQALRGVIALAAPHEGARRTWEQWAALIEGAGIYLAQVCWTRARENLDLG